MFRCSKMETSLADRSRLSLNQITTRRWSVGEAAEACARRGITAIALWRDKIADQGLHASIRAVRDAGLRVSSVCRGGMFPASTVEQRRERIEDNFRAVDEAAALDADALVMVVGGASPVGIESARRMVGDALSELIPYARSAGVKVGLEPLHPMFAADRSVLTTIGEGLSIARSYAVEDVGLILDAFHIWWDPFLKEQIAASTGRVFGFHVSDWLVPLPDVLLGRGMMGDGVIDLRNLRDAIDQAGFSGKIEVEILNKAVWDEDPDSVLDRVVKTFQKFV